MEELTASIRRRKQEQIDLGEDAAHRIRIAQEEALYRQLEKRMSGS